MIISNRLTKLLGITYPIIQAGMAGGPTTPKLVASVSAAGGLGTLGAAYMQPDEIRQAIHEIRKLTDKAFAVNLFATTWVDDFSRQGEVIQALTPVYEGVGLSVEKAQKQNLKTADTFAEQLQILLGERVPIISTAFGLFTPKEIEQCKQQGAILMAMVTTVKEAVEAEQLGYDALVVQGTEAGGHRGTFHIEPGTCGANIGTMALVPQVDDQVHVPVVAAGGIMDGRGLIAALALGAQGVQLGTRFLTAIESGAHPEYQKALLQSNEESTALTKAFSGRPARGIKNRFIQTMHNANIEPLPFPSQNTLTQSIRKEAAKQHNAEYMSLWAGQATRLLKANQSAGEIILEIIEQARHVKQSFM